MPLSTGKVLFDEAIFTNRTEEDGAVLNISLICEPADDPTKPLLKEGEYSLSMGDEIGSWSAKQEHNLVVIYTLEQGTELVVPQAGSVEVRSVSEGYDVQIKFSVDGEYYYAHYIGEIGFSGSAGNIDTALDIEFIDGECFYHGSDAEYPEWGYAQIQMWDVEPDPTSGRVDGNLVKLKLFVPLPTAPFSGVLAGVYRIANEPGEFVAQPGYDDGVNIPTGSYMSQRNGNELNLGMFVEGEIEVTSDGRVQMQLTTADGAVVKGRLDKSMTITDLTGGFSPQVGGLSTLTDDVVADIDNAQTILLDYGDFYANGTRNVVLQILDSESLMGLVVDMIVPAAEHNAPLPEGNYTIDLGYHNEFSFAKGGEQMGQPTGSYYCSFTYENGEYYIGTTFAPISAGEISVEQNEDGIYTLTFDFVDDAKTPHKITGEWRGEIVPYE